MRGGVFGPRLSFFTITPCLEDCLYIMDLLSISEAEEYLDLTSGTGGDVLSNLISESSKRMAQFTGRDGWGTSSVSRTEYHHGGTVVIAPRYWPILSVTSVHDDPLHDWDSTTLVDSADYWVSPESDGFIWMEGRKILVTGVKSVKLIYKGGYAGTSSVPDDLKLAAKVQIKHEWDVIRNPGRAETFEAGPGELTPQVMRVLRHYSRKLPFG